jgi:CheY-like chemotaxis protein
MRILVVEDDHLQSDSTLHNLSREIPGVSLIHIPTEFEFRARFDEIVSSKPDVIVMDVMLRWDDPKPDLQIPPDVAEGGFRRAGIRCKSLLAENEQTRDIPVIFYTVLDSAEVRQDIDDCYPKAEYQLKTPGGYDLVKRIEKILQHTSD